MGFKLLPISYILLVKLSQTCLVRAPSGWYLCPFDTSPSFFKHFLAFWHHKMFQVHLYSLCPSSGTCYSSKEPWFPKWRMVLRSQDLGVRCTRCYWDFPILRPPQWLELTNICVFIDMFTCLYQYIHIHIYLSNHEFKLKLSIPSCSFPFHIFYSLL